MNQDYNNGNPLFIESEAVLPPPAEWTFVEDKLFEHCLVLFPEGTPDRWQSIAAQIPGRSAEEIKQHFDMLVHDVYEIEAGRVQVPDYCTDSMDPGLELELDGNNQTNCRSNSKQQAGGERKKGNLWTEKEHRLFLLGLSKFGKGDWRSISRNAVITRTSTQVASHAQKYFLRQNSLKRKRKRSSIHDITLADINLTIASGDQNMVSGPVGTVQVAPQLQQLPSTSYMVGQYGYPMQ